MARNSAWSACIGDNLIRLDAAEFQFDMERGFVGFRLNGKPAGNVSTAHVRRNLREIETVRIITERGSQLLEKQTVAQRNPRHARVPVQCEGVANTRAKADTLEVGHRLVGSTQKTKSAVNQTDFVNLRDECRRRICLSIHRN